MAVDEAPTQEDNTNSEAENQQTPDVPELDTEQAMEWGDVLEEQAQRKAEENKQEEADDEVNDEAGPDDGGGTDDVDDDEEDAEVEVEDDYEDLAPNTAQDPGEYTPKDYSFEVELNGKVTKISTPEEAAKFADDNAEKFDAPELLAFMRKANKMEMSLDRDKEKYDAEKAAYEAAKESSEATLESVNNIAKEIQYLVSKGKLPKPSPKYVNANWSDPEVAKQPGVKEQVELLTYMREENDERAKLGLKPITSAIDAYNAWQLENQSSSSQKARKDLALKRKRAGAKVAGATPKPVNITPKGVAVGRVDFDWGDVDGF